MSGLPHPACFLGRVLGSILALTLLAAAAQAKDDAPEWKGTIRGQVFDSEKGTPVGYATVKLIWPAPADGKAARRDVQISDPNGAFEFESIPAGSYTLEFSKSGYQASTMMNFTVKPDQLDRADFKLPPLAAQTPQAAPGEPGAGSSEAELEPIPDAEEFVVLGARVEALEASRAESDELINTLSAEEFSKFAASDVADALKFVAGVNVVEGQFAIIRGLEDRYSSTLYNGAPIPSPDPDKQSVQLDLFASDIVSNLVVAKTFGPDLPSNSSGGAINILTHDYPDEIEVKFQAGSGFNENAIQNYLAFDKGSSVGTEESGSHTIESDFSTSIGGRFELFDREVRFKGVAANEIDYATAQGTREGNQPRRTEYENLADPNSPVTRTGDLALGRLSLSDGGFQQTVSERTEALTGYGGLGFDLDEAGNHKLDGSIFYTKKKNQAVDLRENGQLPGFDYGPIVDYQNSFGLIDPSLFSPPGAGGGGGCQGDVCASPDAWIATSIRPGESDQPSLPRQGALWFSSFSRSRSFDIDRDLSVYQINGDHRFDALEGFHFTYALNHAKTTQSETSLASRFSFEPDDEHAPGFVIPSSFPVTVDDLKAAIAASDPGTQPTGAFQTRAGGLLDLSNDISEKGYFGRFDAEYEFQPFDFVTLRFSSGGWYEDAKRGVDSLYRENATIVGSSNWALSAPTREELGSLVFDSIDPTGIREATSDGKRTIKAWNGGLKATLWQDVDVLGGLRIEDISISSDNAPFTGQAPRFSAPATFPSIYLFLDRLDNPFRGEVGAFPNADATFNDQILGIKVPVGPCFAPDGSIPDPEAQCVDLWNPTDPTDVSPIAAFLNGKIDQLEYLPAVSLAYRAYEGLTLRGAWSRTVARPSFREMGFYASTELDSDDLIIGNPQLQLSNVESFDGRVEYFWGELGDMAAMSAFYKTIDNPIESIIVRDPINLEGAALWRTFFNNQNTATLWGIELESRKNLGFLGPEFAEYFSIGGNFTYIDAKVDRSEAELSRAQLFFDTAPGETGRYSGLKSSRRLFGQPKWIANTDITFDHPDWGTKITLVYFAISDLLDAAGNAGLRPDGLVTSYTLDRYIDSFYSLDLVASETLPFDLPLGLVGMEGTLPSALTFKTSIKNLSNSPRGIIYDRAQTVQEVEERRFKVGRDYSFSLTFSLAF